MLLLDSGNICPAGGDEPTKRTNIVLTAMETMGYAAVNAGPNEICCPQSLLNGKKAAFPVISSNLINKSTKTPAADPFLITTAGGIRVGILGILPMDAFSAWPDSPFRDTYDILSPELAVKKYLPGLKKQTDIIILLSQCSADATQQLIQNSEGINIAIVSGLDDASTSATDDCETDPAEPRWIENEPVLLLSGQNGTTLGYLKIIVSEEPDRITYERKALPLDASITGDPVIASMIDDYLNDPIRLKRRRALQNPEQKNAIESLQQLSPEEYIKTIAE